MALSHNFLGINLDVVLSSYFNLPGPGIKVLQNLERKGLGNPCNETNHPTDLDGSGQGKRFAFHQIGKLENHDFDNIIANPMTTALGKQWTTES